ncbi:YqcC family protein [Porticoccaceae bacterium]|nr:YqcC family protein [Porticoccaceae bacterium]MDB9805940.1 YqcC family protein [Porticoccaceae bacterium]MDB9948486.1 YqcC family protein [Porticoccaceae bacterium]
MSERHSQLANLLFDLERELRQAKLWAQQSPPPEALVSTEPFSIDLLTFTEWLQFIFLPKMYATIEATEELPQTCSIAPMAEQYFSAEEVSGKRSGEDSGESCNQSSKETAGTIDRRSIIRLLVAIDDFICGH